MSGRPRLLLPASQNRDEIEELVRRYSEVLRRFFARRAKAADVDDLVQEVFIRIMARSRRETIDNPEGYLFQTAANLLRDQARSRGARRTDLHEPFEEVEHGQVEISPERVLLSQEAVILLVRVLDELPERTREVFLLHRYEGLRHSEIARRMGLSESSIWKHMMKAVAHLNLRLERTKS